MRSVSRKRALGVLAAFWLSAGCSDDASVGARDPLLSVVRIDIEGCDPRPVRAVGVVIGPDLVLTVAHAAAGEPRLSVSTAAGDVLDATVVAIDPAMDLALLSVPRLGLPALGLGSGSAGPAQAVTFPDDRPMAVPMRVRRRVTVKTSDIYGESAVERPGLELSAFVVPGDSGGAVIGSDGRVQGIIWAASRIQGGRAWATESSALAPLLAAWERGEAPPPTRCP